MKYNHMTIDIFKFRILNFGAIVSCVQSPTRAPNSTTVVMKRSGLQLTELTMAGWSIVEDSLGRGWCVEGSHASGLGAIFDGSLWMGSNARGLSSPGLEFKFAMIS